ncbi:iron chaperone [Naasia aerilata]|uniref:YdhG-like domain-containing protein n=1 Tax=Naasia aerilata TaxID=1162966 RepID=A0ABN6XN01_9MICO|nr:DUF1801 domain-containing protein [Naasia aerilata]BDZ46266.1 hypothetical protein GCM10025866_21750 [Naasia aerilata]
MTETAGSTKRTDSDAEGFTAEEKLAMKERSRELKAAARRKAAGTAIDPEQEVLAKIAELPEPDRTLAERLHTIITSAAPALTPKTWYGMPAYAKDGKNIVFFQAAAKFKARYATLGFNEAAELDEGDMWPTSYAIVELTPEVEARIVELVRRATA